MIKDLTALVIDNGIFLPVALRLGREYRKVYYYSPHEKAFPTLKDSVGDGFEEVERVDSPFEVYDKCDLAVFPDIGFSELQKTFNLPSWGSNGGDELEVWRGRFLHQLGKTDLDLPEFTAVRGMTNLKAYLKDKEDQYVKISKFRGDWETFHFRDWEQDESELDARSVKLGPWKELIQFYVFEAIDTNIEGGTDSYCIRGQWPELCIHGMESKDKAYLCAFQKYSEVDEKVRKVNDAFGPILGQYNYSGFFSTEVRITEDGKSYFIDPTCRAGSPPSQVQCEMIQNYGDVIWNGANGRCIDPVPENNFGVQALLTVNCGRSNWVSLSIPDEISQWVKCGFCSKIGGKLVFPPDPDNHTRDIGWLVATGDTPKEAIERLKEYEQALPDGVCCCTEAIAKLIEEAEEAKEQGVKMTDQKLPPPEIVLADVDNSS